MSAASEVKARSAHRRAKTDAADVWRSAFYGERKEAA
jgi:hypothetical protein